MSTTELPALNAGLNGLATVLLTAGYVFIRRRNVTAHKVCMASAVCVSAAFLASYVTYHWLHGSTRFTHPGVVRYVYLAILLTHVVLAAAIVPLVAITVHRALCGEFDRHRRIARWTWPIWMYVSVTGVLIYFALYHWFPGA